MRKPTYLRYRRKLEIAKGLLVIIIMILLIISRLKVL